MEKVLQYLDSVNDTLFCITVLLYKCKSHFITENINLNIIAYTKHVLINNLLVQKYLVWWYCTS